MRIRDDRHIQFEAELRDPGVDDDELADFKKLAQASGRMTHTELRDALNQGDLKEPANRLEQLKGDRSGHWSIRVKAWRRSSAYPPSASATPWPGSAPPPRTPTCGCVGFSGYRTAGGCVCRRTTIPRLRGRASRRRSQTSSRGRRRPSTSGTRTDSLVSLGRAATAQNFPRATTCPWAVPFGAGALALPRAPTPRGEDLGGFAWPEWTVARGLLGE